jgi:pyruvate formate lyase activating enzyme
MKAMKTEKGVIFDIQRYSIHDGPGIRTTVFLKGCPLRCFWCQNPESQAIKPEIFFDRDKCTLCKRCIAACPTGAARLSEAIMAIDRGLCTGCGKFVEVCPAEARRLIGRTVTADEVMLHVLKDVRFYAHSGGGVTLSGGEATAQPHFALSLLQKCKEAGLHTALDTCGYASWTQLKKLLAYTDLVLYDIKHLDPRRHLAATGRDNRLILANIRKIAGWKPFRIRIPLIPGFNDSPEEVRAIARFVKNELNSEDIDLLPYNRLGEGKYAFLDKSHSQLQTQDDCRVQALESLLKSP